MSTLDDFTVMHRIRAVEMALTKAFDGGYVPGLLHPAFGGEALAVGVASRLHAGRDMIFSSHRCHGHAVAGGIDLRGMIHEILGLPDGINGGHAGTQHLNDPSAPQNGSLFISGNGIVGAQVPLALGAALTARNQGTGGIAAVFFGDGAMNQGGVMESFNMALVEKLPVLFVCENNGLAQSTRAGQASAGSYTARAAGFGLKVADVDGRDVTQIQAMIDAHADAIRAGNPLFLEARIDRLSGHYHGDTQDYLTESTGFGSPSDPVVIAEKMLLNAGIRQDQIDAAKETVDHQVNSIIQGALS